MNTLGQIFVWCILIDLCIILLVALFSNLGSKTLADGVNNFFDGLGIGSLLAIYLFAFQIVCLGIWICIKTLLLA